MGEAMRIFCVTADLSDEDLDLPSQPGLILRGSITSVKMGAMLWGEPVDVIAVHDLAHRENLLRRAHDALKAMPDDYRGHERFDARLDQLLQDIWKELQ